mmetsp:Transcript_32586/g.40387  ORF Transcript_32586/g.40387 Transcript_32586/m.40387 type:complete len:82 (+) Transcript_32586:161-406(+)
MTVDPSSRSRETSANCKGKGKKNTRVVDVKVLPKRPMTTTNPKNQLQMTTYGVGQSSIRQISSQVDDENLIKEDEEDDYHL